MRVLLINPNRYRDPPVPPLGLEYLDSALRDSRHESRILDLCFDAHPLRTLEEEVRRFEPQVAGVTVRNIDTGVCLNNVFFLDEIKELLRQLDDSEVPVVLGGSGFSFIPRGVLEYLGASWGISGPGERALPHLLDTIEKKPPPPGTVLDGWTFGTDKDFKVTGRGTQIDYQAYIGQGGIPGFETQKGCYGTCSYCAEASAKLIFRDPRLVLEEISELAGRGLKEFHLCDSEFNQDLSFCRDFLETLTAQGPSITWSLYMRSTPYDEALFRLLAENGARLITLSVPSGPNDLADAERICLLAKKYRIRLAVDLLCGFPGETPGGLRKTIETLRRIRPDTVGVNGFIRLYPGTGMASCFSFQSIDSAHLTGELENNPLLIRPVFYSTVSTDTLREIIGDDPLFKIEGFERSTNYERIRDTGLHEN